ncbi:hypothetical protein [Ralstonia thomasii]|jgi:hypothetical protein
MTHSFLDGCFDQSPNCRRSVPSAKPIDYRKEGGSFESRAFRVLFERREELGICELYKCSNARVDGYLVTKQGENILLEMKECLGWGPTTAAGFQFLAGNYLLTQYGQLKKPATRGIIVFERTSREWNAITPHSAWGQLALHASEIATHIVIGGLQVHPDGHVSTALSV